MQRNDIAKINLNEPLLRSNAGEILATDDRQGNRFGALLFRDGKAVDATGYAVTGYFIRPNGDTVINEGTAQGNMVFVDLAPECYAYEGAFSLAVKVNGPSITSTIRVIDGYVRLTKTERQIAPEGLLPDLEELLAQIAAMENAYAKGANALIGRVTTPFTLTGETVRCYPVPDYPLQVITHLAPHRPGKGEPSPANIRPLSPVSEVYLNQSDVKEYTQALASPVYGGDYYWHEGRLDVTARYRELDGNEGWYLNQKGDTSYFVLNMQDITAIENKAYMSHYRNRPELAFADPAGTYNVFRYQNHSSGVVRLCVRPDLSDYDTTDHDGSVAKWKAYLAAQKAAGTPVQLVYFITAGSEEPGYPESVILSHEGENLFYSALHDTTVSVSGPLDPAYQNAMQDERIEALEESAVSGGGSYTLPIATEETLGGMKVGDGLQVEADGRVSVEPEGVYEPIKTVTTKEGEEVATVAFDVSGYKKIKLIAKIPSVNAEKKAGIFSANTAPMYYTSDMQHATMNYQYTIEFVLRNGAIFLGNYGSGQAENSGIMYGAGGPYPAGVWGFPADSINRIEARMMAGKTFPANSEFSIEGVRA